MLQLLSDEYNWKNVNGELITNFNWIDAFGVTSNRFGVGYKKLFTFRMLSTLIILSSLIVDIVYQSEGGCLPYWGIYFTSWTICINLSYSVTGLYITYNLYHFPENYELSVIPRSVKLHWALVSPAFVASFIVPLIFWPSCLSRDAINASCSIAEEPNTVFLHGINSILVISDVIISKQPFLVLRGLYPLAVGVAYVTFTYVHHILKIGDCYYPNQDVPIYPELDWNSEYNIYKGCAIILGIPVINFLGWYIYYIITKREPTINLQLTSDSIEYLN